MSPTSPPPSVPILLAQPADALRLSALEQACFRGDRISLRSYRRLLASGSAQILLALPPPGDAATALWGSAVILYRRRTTVARIYSIAVAEAARQRGVASALLAAAERLVWDRGCDRLGAEIRCDNTASIATFHKAGFATCGRYEDYYEDGMAALRVQKKLGPAA